MPEVEVLLPVELREIMAASGRRIARLHRPITRAISEAWGLPHLSTAITKLAIMDRIAMAATKRRKWR